MDTVLQEVRALYTVGGIMIFVVLAVMGLLFVVYRANIKAKDDPTPALIDTQKALITEIAESGKRHAAESDHTVKALSGITEELKEGRKVQTSLIELVKEARSDIAGVRVDHATTAAKQAARQAELHTEVLGAITTSQERVISEFKGIIEELNKTLSGLKQSLDGYRKTKRKLSPSLTRSISALVLKIDNLTKEFQVHVHPIVPSAPPASNPANPVPAIKPVYSVVRPDPAPVSVPSANGSSGDFGSYPSAAEWLNGRGRR